MKASLKALAAKLRLPSKTPTLAPTPAPAPAAYIEAEDDVDGYSSAAAEEVINRLCDQLDASQAKVRALTETNNTLTGNLKAANIAISQLNKLPKNRYWNTRAGK